jgi:hypothetical protein
VRQQLWRQAVYRGSVRRGGEWLAVGVGGARIGSEVVIERDVLLKDNDQVVDRRRGHGFRARGLGRVRTCGDETEHCENDGETLHYHAAEAYRLQIFSRCPLG